MQITHSPPTPQLLLRGGHVQYYEHVRAQDFGVAQDVGKHLGKATPNAPQQQFREGGCNFFQNL